MAVLGLRFCVRAFSSCSKWGPLFIAVRGPLTIAFTILLLVNTVRRCDQVGFRELLPSPVFWFYGHLCLLFKVSAPEIHQGIYSFFLPPLLVLLKLKI